LGHHNILGILTVSWLGTFEDLEKRRKKIMFMPRGQWIYGQKYCKTCHTRSCRLGLNLILPNNPLRQQWVCHHCIVDGLGDVVQWHIKKGTIEVSEMRKNVGHECGSSCGKRRNLAPQGMSRARPGLEPKVYT